MLCRSVAVQGLYKIKEAIDGAALAEIRIEKSNLTISEVKELFSCHKNLIATCRPVGISRQERKALLMAAIEGGAQWIDLEIESDFEYCSSLLAFAKEKGCRVIVSYHNYEYTPDSFLLCKVVNEARKKQADLVKIATQVNDKTDNARLLCLYNQGIPIIAIGMGPLGKITRVAALELGAPFTFVSMDDNSKTAPGQLSEEQMRNILNSL
ncbi:MAG: type I 3-dehydroquinate dehydratase [Salinivirgaceae bacterium]